MLELKAYGVMGGLSMSLRCRNVTLGHDHVVWNGWVDHIGEDQADALRLMSEAVLRASRAAERGELERMTSDCG